ncbi:MAG: hypothetical protein SGJ18_03500 [Pseudomonadota bacterium]|nr:hypothetical protein [Pseudomonadota bacterium]
MKHLTLILAPLLFILSFGINLYALPNKLFCGEDTFGCEDHLVDTVTIEFSKGKTKLRRGYKQGDNPWDLTFSGAQALDGKEISLNLDPTDNSFADGKYSNGNLKIQVSCNKSSDDCKIVSKGSLGGWRPNSKDNELKVKDNDHPQVTNFTLKCNSKEITIESTCQGGGE